MSRFNTDIIDVIEYVLTHTPGGNTRIALTDAVKEIKLLRKELKINEAPGKRPFPSVSGNIDREQQRETLGVTAGETASTSSYSQAEINTLIKALALIASGPPDDDPDEMKQIAREALSTLPPAHHPMTKETDQ
jgi:hypothetical protein